MTVTEMAYSSEQVCEMVGITYRQLDYWLRQGYIVVDCPMNQGSGSRRRFSADEVAALIEVVAACRAAHRTIEDFSSGTLWELARTEQDMKGTHHDGPGPPVGRRAADDEVGKGAERRRHPSAGGRGREGLRRVASVGGGDAA